MLPYILLPLVAFAAGFIDAIAGGGGLLTVPVLLNLTPDVRLVLGTNKGQAIFGSFSSLMSFVRAGRVHRKRAVPAFAAALVGSVLGARLVFVLKPETLRPIVLVMLVGVAVFFVARRRKPPRSTVVREPKTEGELPAASAAKTPSETPAARETPEIAEPTERGVGLARRYPTLVTVVVAGVIGTYDGFFGPGTGTFLIVAHTALFGDDLTEASANAKVANFASNLGSVVLYAMAGKIELRWAVPMGIMQMLGALAGTRAAVKGGERVVRAGVLAVTVALVVRLVWQMVS